jgi:transposase InsO family protein
LPASPHCRGGLHGRRRVENAYIESFNGRFRDECLNEHWVTTLESARRIIEDSRLEYNTGRPHSSLNNMTPEQFAKSYFLGVRTGELLWNRPID